MPPHSSLVDSLQEIPSRCSLPILTEPIVVFTGCWEKQEVVSYGFMSHEGMAPFSGYALIPYRWYGQLFWSQRHTTFDFIISHGNSLLTVFFLFLAECLEWETPNLLLTCTTLRVRVHHWCLPCHRWEWISPATWMTDKWTVPVAIQGI